MDGGYSDNLITLDENTITVSPFCGESDICPRDDSSQLFHVSLSENIFLRVKLSRVKFNMKHCIGSILKLSYIKIHDITFHLSFKSIWRNFIRKPFIYKRTCTCFLFIEVNGLRKNISICDFI